MLTATKRNVANHTNVNECEAVYSDTGTSERSQHKAALCAKQEPGEKGIIVFVIVFFGSTLACSLEKNALLN